MPKQTKRFYFKATREGANTNAMQVSIGYELGGYSYYTGQHSGRGYYAYAVPVERSMRNGYGVISQGMFDGAKRMLQSSARFSQKQFDTFNLAMEEVKELIEGVAKEYKMTLLRDEQGNLVECD